MGKTFILGNNKALAERLGCSFAEIPSITTDSEIHNWLLPLFERNNIEKVVVEIGRNEILSLKIGLHIRLSLNELKEKSLVPLFFVSASSLNAVILKSGIWSHILTSKGVYFSSLNDIESISVELDVIQGILLNEYKTGFLDIVKILPDETIGRHSLANIWGAYSLDKAANVNVLHSDSEFMSNRMKLYFKFISALNNLKTFSIKSVGHISLGSSNTINATNKRVLLIDDEADKGWEMVLRKVFKTQSDADFVVINEKVKNYDGFSENSRSIIENQMFDLYLVDLRLNGLEEDGLLNPNDFSGMSVVRKIKSLNQGNQVIIFTASNKVWNMKALLDAGVDGYYMKESPEFGFSSEFSEQNYLRLKEEVERCFDRDFLKDVFLKIQKAKSIINKISDDNFKNELSNQFDLFWNMVSKAQSETDFAYAYVSLYLVIEIINNFYYEQTSDKKWLIKETGNLLDWQWSKEQLKYDNTGTAVVGFNPPEWLKIAGLYFQKWSQTDNWYITSIYHLIQKRNGFVHNDRTILEKRDANGSLLNQDIYSKEGVKKMVDAIIVIISLV